MERRWNLTPRLRCLADWVPEGARLADVGTDHAHLPIWLSLHGRIQSCIASELRLAPLQRAREEVRLSGAKGIRFRLCDGLTGFRPEEADTITIAGLGGENIAAILRRSPWTADRHHMLLLQPMTRAETLRRFLSDNGYAIVREALVRDRGVLYPLMEVQGGEMRLSAGQCWGGARLERDPQGDRYLIEQILRLQHAIAGQNRAGRKDPDRTEELRDIVTELLCMREEWRHANRKGD